MTKIISHILGFILLFQLGSIAHAADDVRNCVGNNGLPVPCTSAASIGAHSNDESDTDTKVGNLKRTHSYAHSLANLLCDDTEEDEKRLSHLPTLPPSALSNVITALEIDTALSILDSAAHDPKTLVFWDFDGVIGAGTGHPDGTPPRFNTHGQWQPRCPKLLKKFQELYTKYPERVQMLSAGNLFYHEHMHYFPSTNPPTAQPINDHLIYYNPIGFHALRRPTEAPLCQKGAQLLSIIQFLGCTTRIANIKRIVFIDDLQFHANGMSHACSLLGLDLTCIWLPHPQLEPHLFRPPSPDALSISSSNDNDFVVRVNPNNDDAGDSSATASNG